MQISININPAKQYIGFTQGSGLVSKIIRRITSGKFNHVFLLFENTVYQAHFGKGVYSISLEEYEQTEALKQCQIDIFETNNLRIQEAKFCVELNIPYDTFDIKEHYERNRSLFDWRRAFHHQNRSKMICTEFVDIISNYRYSQALNYSYPGEIDPWQMYLLCSDMHINKKSFHGQK